MDSGLGFKEAKKVGNSGGYHAKVRKKDEVRQRVAFQRKRINGLFATKKQLETELSRDRDYMANQSNALSLGDDFSEVTNEPE